MKRRFADGGIYTEEMGEPPMELEKVPGEPMMTTMAAPGRGMTPSPVERGMGAMAQRRAEREAAIAARQAAKPPRPMRIPLNPDQSADLKTGMERGVRRQTGKQEVYEKKFAKGGMTASKRADGIAQRGKTRGTMVMCKGGMYKK